MATRVKGTIQIFMLSTGAFTPYQLDVFSDNLVAFRYKYQEPCCAQHFVVHQDYDM